MSEQNIHATLSIYEAAFCLSKNLKLIGKKREKDKFIFYFEGRDAHLVGMEFYNGGKVSAKAFADAYRTLKDFAFKE